MWVVSRLYSMATVVACVCVECTSIRTGRYCTALSRRCRTSDDAERYVCDSDRQYYSKYRSDAARGGLAAPPDGRMDGPGADFCCHWRQLTDTRER